MPKVIYDSMIELQVLNYIFKVNSFNIITSNGITEDYFTTYKEHFNFLKEFYDRYKQLPSKETFQGKFNDNFDWLNVQDPEEYLVEKLVEAKLYRGLVVDFNKIGGLLKDEKSDKAVELMSSISQKYLKTRSGKCVDLIGDANLRYEGYIEKVNNPKQSFASTGIKELDQIIGGWDLKNESAIIGARTGFGKSWWLTYFALQAAKQGFRVGYYSGEMDSDLIGYRLDTFLGGISNGALTHGNSIVQNDYANYIESINKIVPGHLYCITPDDLGGMATVSKLRAFIEKHDINFMCVDQLSLVNDERGARTPKEQMDNISKDLRTLQRLLHIPFLSAAQLNRQEAEDGPTTKNISQSDRIGQDSTIVIFLERKGDNVTFTIGKARNAKTGSKLTYYWDINNGVLRYIPTEKDTLDSAGKDNGAEDLRKMYNDTMRSNNIF